MQQRLVKYLTEDRIFGAQIVCSLYFFMSAVRVFSWTRSIVVYLCRVWLGQRIQLSQCFFWPQGTATPCEVCARAGLADRADC